MVLSYCKRIIFLLTFVLMFSQVHAKRFTSQYTEFALPAGWACALEGTEWVCQSTNAQRKKEAIIILAAKIRGSQDSLDAYNTYLKKPKTFTLPGGKTQVSEAKYAKFSEINKHRWIDSLHLASEVPGFYTRYLATVKEDLGVAVTFSVGKDFYSSYQGIFDKIVASLRVFRQKNANISKFNLKKKDENLLDDTTFIPDSGRVDISQKKKGKSSGSLSTKDMMMYGVGALVLLGVVGFMKKKGKKGAGKKKKKKKDKA